MTTSMTISQLTNLAKNGGEVHLTAEDFFTILSMLQKPMSVKEAADWYGLDRKTVVDYAEKNQLPGRKVGGRWFIYKAF